MAALLAVEYIGVAPSDRLGYPAYFRAVYRRRLFGLIDAPAAVNVETLQQVVNSIRQARYTSDIGVPLAVSTIGANDTTAVIDIRVVPEGKDRTAADLADHYTPSLAWLPLLHAVDLDSLERVTAADVYGDAGNASREAAQDRAREQGELTAALRWLKVAAVVLLALAALYVGAQLLRGARTVTA